MENLLELLNKVQTVSPLAIFEKEIIIVQNAGMQHWLNMSIAQTRGISLNIDYALPSQFLWKLVRTMASKESVPEQTPYSREVLSWRIFQLFKQSAVITDPDFADVVRYFSEDKSASNSQSAKTEQLNVDELKQYQLAVQLADLYEQYLVFRPDWLDKWQHKIFTLELEDISPAVQQTLNWQGKLWWHLQQQLEYNPVTLLNQAIAHIDECLHLLPKRISFFGINAMAPMWLKFIESLSEHCQIHFFHLNPCADYWGDIKSEKQLFTQMNAWTEESDNELCEVGNPLLANLGQQGREFLAMLQDISSYDFDTFESLAIEENKEISVLKQVQNDILQLNDARINNLDKCDKQDDSIVITSAHSHLREVQGLHDWLLHQFNQHDLTPKDVLVMCPQIEKYAPYVNAVFARGWQDLADDIPPLPCSIADRVSKDSNAVVMAYLELLSLPDSRFQISQIMAFLRVQAIQDKFNITNEELEKISVWLDAAKIHWGLDAEHKKQFVSGANSQQAYSDAFTWQQGLSRLLRGFAYAEHDALYQDQLLLNLVEGGDVELLGKFILLIDSLKKHAISLTQNRTAAQWQVYLIAMLENCFTQQESGSLDIILSAIEQFAEYAQLAKVNELLPLSIVKEFLTLHFSEPDASSQFMVGQITFCSMLPMRSIPFKVIAILGLNDGDYPRQRKPVAFDLMQQFPARIGDRSRRGDDRYLFLEALISARQYLYLSYQGRNIKNNAAQQPSLVLKELMAYLSEGYQWQFDDEDKDNFQLRQLPMQAFSLDNYHGKWQSFDVNWLKLNGDSKAGDQPESLIIKHDSLTTCLATSKALAKTLTLSFDELIRFYQHPSKHFAQQTLDLYLQQDNLQLDDNEPFQPENLTAYQIRQNSLEILLDNQLTDSQKRSELATLQQSVLRSGIMPDSPLSAPQVDSWQEEVNSFYQELNKLSAQDIEMKHHVIDVTVEHNGEQIQCAIEIELPCVNKTVLAYRMSSAKPQDLMRLAGYQLALQLNELLTEQQELMENGDVSSELSVLGVYFDTKSQKVNKLTRAPFQDPKGVISTLLKHYFLGQEQALLLNGVIGEKVFKLTAKTDDIEQSVFEKFWCDTNSMSAPIFDDYLQYFWPKPPEISAHLAVIKAVYQPIFSGIGKGK